MEPLIRLTSVVVPLPRDNVDTDAIIPAAYMRSLATDPARGLFARWRYDSDGREDPGFVLNDTRFRGAAILLAGANFGCGSSRENAVWALRNAGFRCIIAQGFSDIFHENCFKNGVLPVVAAPREHATLMQSALRDAPWSVTIDVEARTLVLPGGARVSFALDERKRKLLMSGQDEIDATLAHGEAIRAFRERHRRERPWLYASRPAGDST
jgi:3-isopropylmalate/(R)-2-methylmalate dehydratase small subunit